MVVPRGGELVLSITAHNGEIEWYKNGRPIDRGQSIPSITRVVTRIGGEIVKDEQTLRLKNVTTNDRGIYQVLGRGFQTEDSAYAKVMIYGE